MDLPSAVDAVMFLLFLLLLASLHALASFTCKHPCFWWRSCCCFNSCCCLLFCCCERSLDNRTMAIGLPFFLLSNYGNIEYRIGQLKKVSDYQISDQASIYRTTGYQTQKKLAVAHLCRLDCVSQIVEERPRP
jgi:hypothetical protein